MFLAHNWCPLVLVTCEELNPAEKSFWKKTTSSQQHQLLDPGDPKNTSPGTRQEATLWLQLRLNMKLSSRLYCWALPWHEHQVNKIAYIINKMPAQHLRVFGRKISFLHAWTRTVQHMRWSSSNNRSIFWVNLYTPLHSTSKRKEI